MTDRKRETESADDGAEQGAETTGTIDSNNDRLDRRTVLKGTAAAGLAGAGLSGSASASGWNEITFCAVSYDVFEYHFEVDGQVKRGGTYESDRWDDVGEDFVSGAVSKERCDSFLFTGDVETLRLDGPGKVLINGTMVRDTTKPDLSNTITIEAGNRDVDYKFRVSGQVEPGPKADPGEDVISDNVVRGALAAGGIDNFRYSGAIAFDEATGPVTVTLDINP